MTVNFKAYHFEQNETATKLFNSTGEAKGRLHFFDYVGALGEDRYGVAAEEVDTDTELSCWDWKYFLHKHCDDKGIMKTYKINKASFQKRYGVSDEKMEFLLNTSGVAIPGQLLVVIGEKADQVKAWEDKQQGDKSAFTRNFIESLIKAEINPAAYQALIFSEANNVQPNWDKDALVISYKDKANMPPRTGIPPSRILDIDFDRFEELQEGRPLSKNEISKIIDPLRTLEEWLNEKKKTNLDHLGAFWTYDEDDSQQTIYQLRSFYDPPQYLPLPNSLMIINNKDGKTFDFIHIHASGFIEIKENRTRAQYLPLRLSNSKVSEELTAWVTSYFGRF